MSSDSTGIGRYIQTKCGHDYHRLTEALLVMAMGTAAECETYFGEPVPVTARNRRECVRIRRGRGAVVARLERRLH